METTSLINILNQGGVAIIPTDTIYGLVGQALNQKTVERIYQIKGRTPSKPLIILISNLNQLGLFNIGVDEFQEKQFKDYWPGPVSIILPCLEEKFEYLARGSKSLAFRMPKNKFLNELITQTGPLVAPSANPEGLEPSKNIFEAKEYFGDNVDFYFDGGEINSKPSKIIDLTNGFKIIRK